MIATAVLSWSDGRPWPVALYMIGMVITFCSIFLAAETARTDLASKLGIDGACKKIADPIGGGLDRPALHVSNKRHRMQRDGRSSRTNGAGVRYSDMANKVALRLPVVALSAEYLTIGQLMRRNVLAYKAPPNNQGYDLICIHPDARESTKALRVQVKSRYQTDCDRAFPVKEKSFGSFDYLVVVFLNIGFFYKKTGRDDGIQPPEFYTLPRSFIEQHHYKPASGFQKVRTKGLDLASFKDDKGFEQIARDLGIVYPSRLIQAPITGKTPDQSAHGRK